MSVTTTADEMLNSAKSHVKEAASALSQIVIDEVWGHDEFSEEYKEKIRESLNDLVKIKIKLG